jgi:hypothetical protein
MKVGTIFNLILTGMAILLLAGCTTKYPNRNVVGENFPNVMGESLAGETKSIPTDLVEGQVVLILGFVQNSQFDIDRWLIGLDMTNTNIPVYELPTLQGMFPEFFKTEINNGMRKGIPKELWKGVITVYEDGKQLQRFTGNTNPNNARVLLLDQDGKVIFFYDRGFAVGALKQLRAAAAL